MLKQLTLVLLLVPYLIASANAANHTDDAALFSSTVEVGSGKASHPETTTSPTVVKPISKVSEEHSKSVPIGSSRGNISLDLSGHKVETTKLELAKPINHVVTNGDKLESIKPTEHGSAKLEMAKSAAGHNVSSTIVEVHKATTATPVSSSVDKVASAVKHAISSGVSSTSKSDEAGHVNATIHKFDDYLKPICESTDKIQPKALLKIQSQFKQFVQLTDGKLGTCFSEHYSFNPSQKLVNSADLKALCASKSSHSGAKGSYKAFSNCASSNWGASVNKELDHIIEARLNCTKNHQHSKNGTVSTVTLGDHENDDEVSLISEVVSKVLDGDKTGSVVKNSDIKFLDFTGSTTHKPISNASVSSSLKQVLKEASTTITPASVKNLLNDPNTVLVLMDDSKTTKKPTAHEVSTKTKVEVTGPSSSVTTSKPVVLHSTAKFELPSHVKLTVGTNKESAETPASSTNKTSTSLGHKILSTTGSASTTSTSSKPVAIVVETTTKPSPSLASTKKVEIVVKGTKSPASKVETTHSTDLTGSPVVVKVNTTSVAPAVVVKPLESLGELMTRQEKEKSELERKLKVEREKVLKQLQKKQDELDAQNAIKALQIQRQATAGHSSDNRLHQLEHERQMTIDPIGHTMKHQQYEMSKQQKTTAGRV